MVVRLLTRGDPAAAIKAGVITGVLYLGLYSVPDEQQREFSRWVQNDPNAPYLLGAALLVVFILLTLFSWRRELWLMATFRNFPKATLKQTAAVLWLHGVGDSGAGFEWLRRELSYLPHVVVLLPDAEERTLAAAGGGVDKRAWFGLEAMPVTLAEPDPDALDEAVAKVHAWIDGQAASGIPPSRLVLGGFSQGAAVAAWAAATCPHKLAGVVLWSGWAPKPAELEAALRQGANGKGVPFIACHGGDDRKVLPACGQRLGEALVKAGVLIKSRQIYDGLGHGCAPEQLEALKDFVAAVLPIGIPKTSVESAAKKAKGKAAKVD